MTQVGEEIMTLAFFVLIQYRSVTDRRTDGRTDGHLCSVYTSACTARYANALVKTLKMYRLLTMYKHSCDINAQRSVVGLLQTLSIGKPLYTVSQKHAISGCNRVTTGPADPAMRGRSSGPLQA